MLEDECVSKKKIQIKKWYSKKNVIKNAIIECNKRD